MLYYKIFTIFLGLTSVSAFSIQHRNAATILGDIKRTITSAVSTYNSNSASTNMRRSTASVLADIQALNTVITTSATQIAAMSPISPDTEAYVITPAIEQMQLYFDATAGDINNSTAFNLADSIVITNQTNYLVIALGGVLRNLGSQLAGLNTVSLELVQESVDNLNGATDGFFVALGNKINPGQQRYITTDQEEIDTIYGTAFAIHL